MTIWHFTLPNLYWDALNQELQNSLIRNGIRPSGHALLLTKHDQVNHLTILRDKARLQHSELNEQEEIIHRIQNKYSLTSSHQRVRSHTLSTIKTPCSPQYHFDPVVLEHKQSSSPIHTSRKRKDDSDHYNTSSSNYNSQSWAEQTMTNAYRSQAKSKFISSYINTHNSLAGVQYPMHPDGFGC